MPATVPNGPGDSATFGVSITTSVSLSDAIEVNEIIFDAGSSPYTIEVGPGPFTVTISGRGITNNSGITQAFDINSTSSMGSGEIAFMNTAVAGNSTLFATDGTTVRFYNASSADRGSFNNSNIGDTEFHDSATADHGTFSNDGAPSDASWVGSGRTYFYNTSSAANAVMTNNGASGSITLGGITAFYDTSTAANATIIGNGGTSYPIGGTIYFYSDSSGGASRLELFQSGAVDISFHNAPGLAVGSIEGDGLVFLGSDNLTVGNNGLNTAFSGTIQDGGAVGGSDGSLTKTGIGKLTLSGANTYTGGTVVNAGTLLVANKRGSGTGAGTVVVNAGKLGGTGRISGRVIVGDGLAPEAYLTPGVAASRPATLAIGNTLTFQADGTLHFGYKSNAAGDKVIARGVTINGGAELFFGPIDTGTLAVGTVFTVINNTAATSIVGTFRNLPDGFTITVGSNTFQANYEGGDGNDLTLTVVP